jgi:hypothetical protein
MKRFLALFLMLGLAGCDDTKNLGGEGSGGGGSGHGPGKKNIHKMPEPHYAPKH